MMDETKKDAQNEIKITLKEFISENFLISSGTDTFEDTESFMETGIIDSTGVLELLEFIEERFKITVEDEEIVPENLDSLNKLTSFIEKKMEDAG